MRWRAGYAPAHVDSMGRDDRFTDKLLGSRTRMLRRLSKLTQEQLAEVAGLSGDSITKIENGRFSPTVGTLRKLAAGLNVPVVKLLVDDFDDADALAVLVRNLPEPHRSIAAAILGAVVVSAALGTEGKDRG